jgi:formylglycine-generating enzyme required for sulfatase activity
MNYPPLDQIGPSLTLGPDFTTRRGYRLMTIDEWEHLGRAGTSTDFFFGSDPDLLSRYGWIASNSPDRARPVGLLRPSPFGLLDLLGNTNEWCFNPAQPLSCDCPDPNHQAAPRMPTCRPLQALRGGSIRASSPQNLTVSAFRQAIHNRWLADQKIIATGFRIVRTLE